MNVNQLSAIVSRLERIVDNGTASEMMQTFSREARDTGLPSYRGWQAESDLKSREIAKLIETMFGWPVDHTLPIVSRQLCQHPRQALALDLLDHYTPSAKLPTAEDLANWNPVTGGPAVEKWEAEQHQIELARAQRSAPKQKERAW